MDSNDFESREIDDTRKDNPYNGQDNGKEYTDRIRSYEENGKISARFGFHGYVDHPMHFLAGEAGRERIEIHKQKRRKHNNENIIDINMPDVSKYFGGRY